MFAIRGVSGLVEMKFCFCERGIGFGLPMMVPSMQNGDFCCVNQSFVALTRILLSQDDISGKPITLPMKMLNALPPIGKVVFQLKRGCHDAMMHHA